MNEHRVCVPARAAYENYMVLHIALWYLIVSEWKQDHPKVIILENTAALRLSQRLDNAILREFLSIRRAIQGNYRVRVGLFSRESRRNCLVR